jgi:DNA-directed RNA polymerase specialized sigma24 family protein
MNPAPISRITGGEAEGYATMSDFCKLFVDEMDRLYQLSFLLTGDHEKAEQCFVAGLEDSVKQNLVFKQWARAWAKRMIVVNAIRMIAPRPEHAADPPMAVDLEFAGDFHILRDKEGMLASVLELADFERFVFVMSVLERFPDEDGSALLGCSLQDFREARTRALVQVARSDAKCAKSGVEALTH